VTSSAFGRRTHAVFLLASLGASVIACKPVEEASNRPATSLEFPSPYRPVSEAGDTQFSTEAARDEAGEAKFVMDWAGIKLGTTVADIGAGEGYYTIRLWRRISIAAHWTGSASV
jgi:predicted methyltransferase